MGSNNTGELSAICEALLYFLEHKIIKSTIILIYDSKWAANMVRGIWQPKSNRQLVRTARTILRKVEATNKVTWKWVKGHRGHLMNDRADKNADKGKLSSAHFGGRHGNPSSPWLDPCAFSVETPSSPIPASPRL